MTFHLSNLTQELKKIQEQIATGKRINKPSDDPIGASRAMRLRKALSQIDQYEKNIQFGSTWLNVTDVALKTIQQFLSQAVDVASQMSIGTGTTGERQAAAQSIQNLLNQIIQVGNTQLDGRSIFAGFQDRSPAYSNDLLILPASAEPGNSPAYTGTVASSGAYTGVSGKSYMVEVTTGGAVGVALFRVSEDGGVTWGPDDAFTTATSPTAIYQFADLGVQIAFSDSGTLTAGDRFSIDVSRYQGDSGEIEIVTSHSSRVDVNLTGNEVFGPTGNDLFDVLTGLKNGLETNDRTAIQASMASLVRFQTNLIGLRSEVGSRQERIGVYKKILSELDLNHSNRLSEVEGIDIAQVATLLQVKQVFYESALYSANQLLRLNFVDFMR